MTTLNRLSLTQAARGLRRKDFSSVELVKACIARVEKREADVKAWASIDVEAALEAAGRADSLAADGHWLGPFHGLPFGIKDIFDVAGFKTAYGTSACPPATPTVDATSVARLKHAGAIILGKTITTAFATGDPGPTHNPWHLDHTPGGSSSGSAAAVADGMCLAALGTQTAGSVIRPCSFNGLAGIKPGHHRIDVRGVLALSWRLDHIGALTRSVADADVVWQVLRDDRDWRKQTDYTNLLTERDPITPLRLWRPREMFDDLASDEMRTLMDRHCMALANEGIEIIERKMPPSAHAVLDMHRIIMAAEAAASHAERFAEYGDAYPPRIKEHIVHGQGISATDYLGARQHRRQMIDDMVLAMTDVDAMISPAAVSAAPLGLGDTGDRAFNAPSTYLGLPIVCYGAALNSEGLPLGLQLMGRPDSEDELLGIGAWCEALAGFSETTAMVAPD